MKKFIKLIFTAVAMLLSVNVWANQPAEKQQDVACTIQDIEQVKCKITATICGKEYSWNTTTSTEEDCNKIQIVVTAVSISLQNCD